MPYKKKPRYTYPDGSLVSHETFESCVVAMTYLYTYEEIAKSWKTTRSVIAGIIYRSKSENRLDEKLRMRARRATLKREKPKADTLSAFQTAASEETKQL